MAQVLGIALGGALGAVLRYGVQAWIQGLAGGSFPWGTVAVNVLGCFGIGMLAVLFEGPLPLRPELRLAVLVGLLGGFTTFSTYAWEGVLLARDGQLAVAAANVLVSNAAGLLAAWAGARVATAVAT